MTPENSSAVAAARHEVGERASRLIGDLQHLDALDAFWCPHLDDIAFPRFQKRLRHRRDPADFVEFRACFVDAYDPDSLFFVPRVAINDRRAEIDPLPIPLPRGIDG